MKKKELKKQSQQKNNKNLVLEENKSYKKRNPKIWSKSQLQQSNQMATTTTPISVQHHPHDSPLEFCLTQLNSKEGAVEAAATASSTTYILATLKLV